MIDFFGQWLILQEPHRHNSEFLKVQHVAGDKEKRCFALALAMRPEVWTHEEVVKSMLETAGNNTTFVENAWAMLVGLVNDLERRACLLNTQCIDMSVLEAPEEGLDFDLTRRPKYYAREILRKISLS